MKADEVIEKLGLSLCTAVYYTMRLLREQQGMTQVEVAERMGVHPVAVSKMERHDNQDIRLLTLVRHAEALDVPAIDLLTSAAAVWDLAVQGVKQMPPKKRRRAYESVKELNKPQMLQVLLTMGEANG